ncbi:MAG: MFS transporter, partial [Pirellulaceae bacterium]|nr:MFS transporter [Pirellulaceae bacterium]
MKNVLYYGWVIVLVAAVAMAATLPGRTHGLGMITKPLIVDFGGGQPDGQLTTVSFAAINFWATMIGALFCIPCGWLLDRFGIKNLVAAVLAGLALVVIWMSFIRDIPSLVVAITLTRGIGQSMLSVVSITMVGKWFQKNLSVAMGIYSVCMGMLMGPGSKMLNSRVTEVGWREAWWELGLLLLVTSPLAWLATRNRPQDATLEFGPLAVDGALPADRRA